MLPLDFLGYCFGVLCILVGIATLIVSIKFGG